jgi:hypothetical protein
LDDHDYDFLPVLIINANYNLACRYGFVSC